MPRPQKSKSSPEKKVVSTKRRQDNAKGFPDSESKKPSSEPRSQNPIQNLTLKKLSPKSRRLFARIFKVFFISFLILLAVIGSQYFVSWLFRLILPSELLSSPVIIALYSCLAYFLAIALIFWLVPTLSLEIKTKTWQYTSPALKKPTRHSLGLSNFPTWTDIGLAPIGYLVSLIFAAGLIALFSFLPWFNADEPQATVFSPFLNAPERLMAFFILVIVAPMAEEVLFRGWLYDRLRHLVSLPLAIFLTSLLFAVVHGQWNVGVTVFALSVVMCLGREITGTIYAGILLHILKNAIAFYLIYVIGFV